MDAVSVESTQSPHYFDRELVQFQPFEFAVLAVTNLLFSLGLEPVDGSQSESAYNYPLEREVLTLTQRSQRPFYVLTVYSV